MILIQVIQQQVKLLVEWLRLNMKFEFLAILNIGLELNSTIEKSNAL
jgi:hypothetical protein